MSRTVCFLFLLAALSTPAQGQWQELAPGMELGTFAAREAQRPDDSPITILRIDPERWDLVLIGRSQTGDEKGKTAKDWSRQHDLTAAINAGMFGTDYQTHVGYLRSGKHVNNDNVNNYKSVAAFDPRTDQGLPRFRIFDLDKPEVEMKQIQRDYASVVQNLRLIKRPGKNRWKPRHKRWSEAALGEDDQGRALFIFSRTPFSMYDLNRRLLSLGIGLVAAQHLEGGPQAQIYLRAGDVEREMFGRSTSYFLENGVNPVAWPIPNVLGVRPRQPASN